MLKKIIYPALAVLVIIQFIRPSKNQSDGPFPNEISAVFPVPDEVQTILKTSCYDCHSNNTIYPWYNKVQPVAWWLQHHVNEAKKELNFTEFATYPPRRQNHKLEDVAEQVKKGEMPLNSYTWMHKDAILSDQQKQTIINWANSLKKEIALKNNLGDEKEEREAD